MTHVGDTNSIFKLVSDSMTRRPLVELEYDLLTPTDVHDDLEMHQAVVFEKSNLTPTEVEDLIEIFFKRVDVTPLTRFLNPLNEATQCVGYRSR